MHQFQLPYLKNKSHLTSPCWWNRASEMNLSHFQNYTFRIVSNLIPRQIKLNHSYPVIVSKGDQRMNLRCFGDEFNSVWHVSCSNHWLVSRGKRQQQINTAALTVQQLPSMNFWLVQPTGRQTSNPDSAEASLLAAEAAELHAACLQLYQHGLCAWWSILAYNVCSLLWSSDWTFSGPHRRRWCKAFWPDKTPPDYPFWLINTSDILNHHQSVRAQGHLSPAPFVSSNLHRLFHLDLKLTPATSDISHKDTVILDGFLLFFCSTGREKKKKQPGSGCWICTAGSDRDLTCCSRTQQHKGFITWTH